MLNLELAKEVAINAVKGAGDFLITGLEKEKVVTFKGKGDIVTHVDLESEKFIMELIQKNFPDHSILSEESGFTDKKSEYVWVLDPIDGTMNYFHGLDPFCVALCLLEKNELIISAVYNPVRNNLYFAEKGKGTTLNGNIVKVSDSEMENSLLATGLSSKKENRDRLIPKLEEIYGCGAHMRMIGSGIYSMAMVASAECDVFFSIKTNPWDILPGALLVQEAGGKVTGIKGEKISISSTSVIATNGINHDKMLTMLKDI